MQSVGQSNRAYWPPWLILLEGNRSGVDEEAARGASHQTSPSTIAGAMVTDDEMIDEIYNQTYSRNNQ